VGEGAALPSLGLVCPLVGLATSSAVGGFAAIYGGASWEAGRSWKLESCDQSRSWKYEEAEAASCSQWREPSEI